MDIGLVYLKFSQEIFLYFNITKKYSSCDLCLCRVFWNFLSLKTLLMFPIIISIKLCRSYSQLVRLLRRGISPVARPLSIQKTRGQTSMRRVGFELEILVFQKGNTFNAAERTATLIGSTRSQLDFCEWNRFNNVDLFWNGWMSCNRLEICGHRVA